MKFNDVSVNKNKRYSLGIEQDSNRYYISINIANGHADYDEYYEISKEELERFLISPDETNELIERCRTSKNDEKLIHPLSLKENRKKTLSKTFFGRFEVFKKIINSKED